MGRQLLARESVGFLEVDKKKRKVKQVLIKAGLSLNGYIWPKSVLQAAIPMFEGTRTYSNHISNMELFDRPERDIGHITGWIENVKWDDKAEGLVGDRYFTDTLKGNDSFALIDAIANGNAPANLIGASVHVLAIMAEQDEDGDVEEEYPSIEEITRVISVDDVTDPAAGGGFPVAASHKPLTQVIMSRATYDEWLNSRKDYADRLKKQYKSIRQSSAMKDLKADNKGFADQVLTLQREKDKLESQLSEMEGKYNLARKDANAQRVLRRVQEKILPAWRKPLERALMNADQSDWEEIIKADLDKARATSEYTRSGSSEKRDRQIVMPESMNTHSYLPRADESLSEYNKRRAKGV